MAKTSDLNRVTAVVLRFMRGPILVMIIVYAIGIMGMAMMPGQDAYGNPQSMSLFHAFYFFTYTATTTGFGEIPHNFTDEQRLWTILCLYMGVIAWLYAIGSIIKLVQNPYFLDALAERQFVRSVRSIWTPFYVVCGFGDTGSLLTRGFSDHELMAVVIDGDAERIKALALRDYRVKMPGLCADASVPNHLIGAGITHPMCKGVVALSADERLNLKISVMTRYLNPGAQVICRTTSPELQKQLNDMHGITVVNPFELFASQLRLTVSAPKVHMLSEWLVGAHNATLDSPPSMRKGRWILCGYGRMGSSIQRQLTGLNIETVVIDPEIEDVPEAQRTFSTYGNHDTLEAAGICSAAGLVVGTDSDTRNLSILRTAQQFNSEAFMIVRQNRHENELVFDAARVDLNMQESLVTARNILLHIVAPAIQDVIGHLEDSEPEVTESLLNRLKQGFGDQEPHLLSITIGKDTPAVEQLIQQGLDPCIADLIRMPSDLNKNYTCIPLAVTRDGQTSVLPEQTENVLLGDVLLFCATANDAQRVIATLKNPYRLSFLITGYEEPTGYFFKWLTKRLPSAAKLARRYED